MTTGADRQGDTAAQGVNLPLVEGQLYAVGGGVFTARFDAERGNWELRAWMGHNGFEVTRTGFDIDAAGGLHDKLYDVETEAAVSLVIASYSVADLQRMQSADVWLPAQAIVQDAQQAKEVADASIWER